MNLARYLTFMIWGTREKNPRRRKQRRGPCRDPKYRAFVRTFPCACGCGRGPSQAAHTGSDGGTSQKSSDRSCIPLYWECHREFDNGLRSGSLFLQDHAIDLPHLVRDLNRQYREERERAA
jgi:hypothetical protein